MQMYCKKYGCSVKVYRFFENRTALIFNPSLAGKQNGNGWDMIPLKTLIPLEYYNEHKDSCFMSKTERNKIKARLTLTKAEWACTDGLFFNDCNEAIAHEYELVKKENENNVE